MKHLLLLALLVTTNCYSANWECVSRTAFCHTWRMWVTNGWVVSGEGNENNTYAMTFVPDQEHKWKI